MKRITCILAAGLMTAAAAVHADLFVKADNTTNLNEAASWTNGAAPGAADIAVWNNVLTGANSSALSASVSWSGVRVLDPGGAVTILSSVAGATLTLGADGIDLSAAPVNMTINPSLVIAATQTWSVAGGRSLTLLATSRTGTGTGDLVLTRASTGTAIVTAAQNGNTATWRAFTGNWIVNTGVSLVVQGQHGDALGQGSVLLQGGRLAQTNGNWNVNNRIVVGPGGGTIDSQSSVGSRYMTLSGGLYGSEPLQFLTSLSGSLGEGFILVASNEFSGPVTIAAGGAMKIGGSATTNFLSNGNGTNGSLDQVTAITNNGTLRIGRTDGYVFRPDLRITGSGTLRVNTGCFATVQSADTLAASQLLSLGGPLTLAGEQTVASISSVSTETNGDVLGCGTLTIAAGSASGSFYYGGLSSVTNLRLRVGAQTIAQPNGSSSGTGNYLVMQRPPPAGLALDTGSSTASRKDFGYMNDADLPLSLSSLTGYGAIRGDAGGIAGHPRLILVDQAVDTTFNGGLVAGGLNRNIIFSKSGTGTLTMAGFIGYQSGQSGVVDVHVSNGTLNVVNDNATPPNGTTGVWTIAQGGALSFAANALGRGGSGTVVLAGGTLRWNAANAQDVSSRLVLRDGTTSILDSGVNLVSFAAPLATGPAGDAAVVKLGSGRIAFATSNAFTGPLTVGQGTVALVGAGDLASASIVISNGVTLDVSARDDGAVTVRAGQELSGAGTVQGVLVNNGVVRPGDGMGTLIVDGSFTQTNGTLALEIGGIDAGTYDVVVSSSPANLGGTLQVTLVTNFVPAVGDAFTVMIAGSLHGGFAATNLPDLGTNRWVVDASGSTLVLSVTNAPSGGPAGYEAYALAITNPADRGYGGDPDGDSYANLLEYATGASATNADEIARLLGARTGGALQVVFPRNTNAVDVTIVVEGSDELAGPWLGILTNRNGAWSGPAAYGESGAGTPVQVTVTDVTNAPARHLRLRVSRP